MVTAQTYVQTPFPVLSPVTTDFVRSKLQMHLDNRAWADDHPEIFSPELGTSCLAYLAGVFIHDLGGMGATW